MNITRFISLLFCLCLISLCAKAQDNNLEIKNYKEEVSNLTEDIAELRDRQVVMQTALNKFKNIQRNHIEQISSLKSKNKYLQKTVDSLRSECSILSKNQKIDKEQLTRQIGQTKVDIKNNHKILSTRTNIGSILFAIILIMVIAITIVFFKKYKRGINTIDKVLKAQNTLDQAQKTLQEESLKLDNKFLEVAEKYVSNMNIKNDLSSDNEKLDHSLVLKVANEITRMEANLSKMDENIRGYKHLLHGVQRIKENFIANDYEIVDMLGKPYQSGIRAIATFKTDENLKPGQQIITRIIKPQINYKQKMIQAAEIEVSQAD